MRYQYTSPASFNPSRWGRPGAGIIKRLVLINAAIWLTLYLLYLTSGPPAVPFALFHERLFSLLGLVPKLVWSRFMVWQPFTYMFLHAGFWHVAMNMFVLWMFGSVLEREWGGAAFLRYYFLTGAGAGLVTVLFGLNSTIPVVGASGAVYGVLLAYGLAYPDRELLIFPFMIPVKAKYFVGFMAVMAFLLSIQPGGSTVAHLTHLSGMVIGWFYLRTGWRSTWFRLAQRVTNLQQERRIRHDFREAQEDEQLRRQVDQILDKISTSGYASLTEEDQDILYRASVRFADKNTKD
ncbi:MAG: rhomboid family intramembrane serine protease [Candidatus Neomarinimicrobiota bacterium]